MTRSMTGYGRAERSKDGEQITVEMRALNSKQLDIQLKMPTQWKDLEIDVRNLISEKLQRGKVEVSITMEGGLERKGVVNKELAKEYHGQLTALAKELNIDLASSDLLGIILRLPEVLQTEKGEIDEEHSAIVLQLVSDACDEVTRFREDEGKKLSEDLKAHSSKIKSLQEKCRPFIEKRIPVIRERISKNLEQFLDGKDVDKNRFEQELIFYMEKYDVSEEMTRLDMHCTYFNETLDAPEDAGKKLGFICQEIGREINTLGAKSYDADMQKYVVVMKDELEKIKEQVLNVL